MRETHVSADSLIYRDVVVEGAAAQPVASMPGIERL